LYDAIGGKRINQNDNLMKEVIEKQQSADEGILANSEMIKKSDEEIHNLTNKNKQ
jgi:hypothetical protein